jgi:hypothetical protein
VARLRDDPDTRAWAARRAAQGKSPREIRQCRKRFVAHRSLGQVARLGGVPPPVPAASAQIGRLDRLGGLIHEYAQVA